MAAADSDESWLPVQAALERYLLARGDGATIDVLTACGGDAALAARVHEVLGQGHDLLIDPLLDAAAEPVLESFGDFDVLRRIGRGGMGSVFLARQKSLGRLVALKVLTRGALSQPAARLRMKREAELTALLDHPNIVPVYCIGELEDTPFIAMKYLAGPSLADVERPLPPERVARIGLDLARALDAAHTHGVVHRDVKPGNVLLDGDTPVIVDFGLARAQSDATLTQEGKVAGTLRYMAPERLERGGAAVDPRIDVYGLGATLYELLAERGLFAEETPTALLRAILTRDPAPLRLPGRHHDLETIVLRALAKEPARRFPNARELAADLERYLAGRPVQSRRLSWLARAQRRAQRHPRASLTIAASLLLAIVAAVLLAFAAAATGADRARRLANTRADLAAGRFEAAERGALLLATQFADDVEVAAVLAAARAETAFDRLLAAVADRAPNVDTATLGALLDGAAPATDPAFALAAVLARAHLTDRAAALRALAELPPAQREGRAGKALACWLGDVPAPWTLPAARPGATSGEAAVTALLLRLAGHGADQVLAEVAGHRDASAAGEPPATAARAARRDAPRDERATGPDQRGDDRPAAAARADASAVRRSLFVEAIARADAGDPHGAEQLLRGLADADAPGPVWRWLGLVQLRLGQAELAHAALARADAAPSAEFARVQLAFATAAPADRANVIAELRERPVRSAELERLLCEFDGKSAADAVDDAVARLAALHARQAGDRIGQDLTTAAMIEVAAWHLPGAEALAAGAELDGHHDLLDAWSARADGLRYAPAVATARAWLARSSCLCGEPHVVPGLAAFAAAITAQPLRARPIFEYAAAVARLPRTVDPAVRTHHLANARHALATLEAAGRDRLRLASADAKWLAWHACVLAVHANDLVEVARRAPPLHDLLPDELRRVARTAAEHAARLREPSRR